MGGISIDEIKEEFSKGYRDKSRIYFIEKYLTTFNAFENKKVPFNLFPRQKVLLNEIVNKRNIVTTKHRQSGVTTTVSAYVCAECIFCSPKSPEIVLCLGNSRDISEQLVEKVCDFMEGVPRYFFGPEFYHPNPSHPNNFKSIYKLKNKSKVVLFNGSTIHARSSGKNASRGISAVSMLIMDEAAFIEDGFAVYSQAVVATASVKNARVVLISTPNGKDELYYKMYDGAINKKNSYSVVEFKWVQDPRYNRFLSWYRKNEETNDVEIYKETLLDSNGNIEYNEEHWEQMYKDGWLPTSPWYEKMKKDLNNDERKIAQELDLSFLGSSDNVIPKEVIEAHSNENVIEITDDAIHKDPFEEDTWVWELPQDGHRYVIGCDNSSGSSEDNTAIQVLDIDAIDENGLPYINQVLEYNGKKTGDEIGVLLERYGMYYNNALIVVEDIGGYGSASILYLLNNKYPNLYYDDPGLKTITILEKYKRYNIKNKNKLPGFHTSSMRQQMVSNFIEHLKANTFRVRSKRTIGEMETWVWKNGRADHTSGSHDDLLMCLAMTLFVIQYSVMKNNTFKMGMKRCNDIFLQLNDKQGFGESIELQNNKNKYLSDNDIMLEYYKEKDIKGGFLILI